jgi:hypothetical protein
VTYSIHRRCLRHYVNAKKPVAVVTPSSSLVHMAETGTAEAARRTGTRSRPKGEPLHRVRTPLGLAHSTPLRLIPTGCSCSLFFATGADECFERICDRRDDGAVSYAMLGLRRRIFAHVGSPLQAHATLSVVRRFQRMAEMHSLLCMRRDWLTEGSGTFVTTPPYWDKGKLDFYVSISS